MSLRKALNPILRTRYLITPTTSYCFTNAPNIKHNVIWYSTEKPIVKSNPNEIDKKKPKDEVKENLITAWYTVVVIGGIGLTVWIFYSLYWGLFSRKSPYSVYSEARERCLEHPQVQDALGMPIKAFGESSRRGHRRHVSHMNYIKNGVSHMKVLFYLQGTRRRATVEVDVKENKSGDYEYASLYVKVPRYGIIVIEDNQNRDIQKIEHDVVRI
ncbi:hypothetical protein DMN91_011113 [Ooceraea biroi]|uniref:Mitochondrial import inner membrane translocase subunit Tim21 n=1 Tax=Ooceraea biroi TaxID=2015173 RepID=A0A026WSF2_OOCBI|nr:mitochondrial import inner membrane translocase subunit Tim21 [Ooceraea biroi]XP_011331309.1 mitochondrial import inner membrane translocase subunit Tim21 [Ooceraea biroi]XP_011331310.1 mitochondrial import inner membrane translocase subunit Tim21 [Ooceraea biroi]EZA58975.1 TIM21-like protein, mitochondrial [Ooceraea biroi]RLU17044.1 hypothetical protein DMN91_011113 [Ooceraea biroi]